MKRLRYDVYISNKKRKKMSSNNSDSEDDDTDDKKMDILSSLLNKKIDCIDRHIYFNDNITNRSISKLIKLIKRKNFEFEQLERKIFNGKIQPLPLYLHINSYGGDLQEGLLAADCIINSKIPIYTIIEGKAASAATFLSICGKKRFITENSTILIQQLSGGFWGKFQEMEDEQKNNKFFMKKMYDFYSKYTKKIKRTKLKEIMKHDLWWNATTAIRYGFVDQIYYGEED